MASKLTPTKKSALLDNFLESLVQITTGQTAAVQGPDGEMLELPLAIEGTLLDYDSEYLLLGQAGRDALELVRRDSVLGIKEISEEEMMMTGDGQKPPFGEMN